MAKGSAFLVTVDVAWLAKCGDLGARELVRDELRRSLVEAARQASCAIERVSCDVVAQRMRRYLSIDPKRHDLFDSPELTTALEEGTQAVWGALREAARQAAIDVAKERHPRRGLLRRVVELLEGFHGD